MEEWGMEKKWLMINQDHQAELLGSGMRASKLKEAALERASLDISRLPTATSSSPLVRSYTQARRGEDLKPSKSASSPSPNSTPAASIHKPSLYSINTNSSDTSQSTTNSSVRRSPTITRSPGSPVKPNLNVDHYFDKYSNDENSPEFFVKKFLDPNLRSVTTKIAASLEVSLRTRSIE